MMHGTPRILIIRLSAIGDVVRVLPALHAIRDNHPYAQIDWAVEQKSAEAVLDHPALDQVIIFERPADKREAVRAFRQFCKRVRAENYEVVVDFHGILKSGYLAWRSGARTRYGFAPPRAQEFSWLFTNKRTGLPREVLNRVEENLRLAEALGPRPAHVISTIAIPSDLEQQVDHFVDDFYGDGKLLVAMHAPVERAEKQWPLENYAALCDLLNGDGRFDVLLTWGPGQRPIVEKVADMCRRRPQIAPETAGLKDYAALLQRCDIYIGGDTGPMHIAAAVNTPVLGIFGGTDPRRHAPFGAACEVLYAGDAEGDSHGKEASERLAAITPEDAYDACLRFLRGQKLLAGPGPMDIGDDESPGDDVG